MMERYEVRGQEAGAAKPSNFARICVFLKFFGRADFVGISTIPVFFVLAVGLIGVFAASLEAQETGHELLTSEERTWLDQNPGKATLLFNVEFPPIEFISSEGTFVGMGADVIRLVEKRLGLVFSKKPSDDWNLHLAALESGECAIAPTIVRTKERERYAYFTTPYATVPVVIIGTRMLGTGLELDNLAGKKVAVVSGYATEQYLHNTANDRFTIMSVADVPEGLRATAFGQVDAYVENLAVAAYYIDREGIPNLRVAGSTDYAFAWSIGVSRKYPLLFSAIQKALHAIPPQELDAVRKRWISLQVQRGMSIETIRLLKISAGFAVLLLICLTGISFFLKRKLKEKVANLEASQQAVLDQAELLKLATESTQAGIWDLDLATGKNFMSTQWFNMLGYVETGRKVILSELKTFIHPEDYPGLMKTVQGVVEPGGRELFEQEFRLRRADDSWCWVLSKGRVTAWDEKGVPSRIIGLDINIQNIKEAQLKMAQSEAKFRAIFDHSPYAIVINSMEDGRYLEANPAFLESRGVSREELNNLRTKDFALLSDNEAVEIVGTILKNGSVKNLEAATRQKDGSLSHVLYSSVLLELQGQQQILSMTVDITEKKSAEKALRESEARFRSLFEMAPLPLVEVTRDGSVLAFNNRFTEMLGYTVDDVPNLDCWWVAAYPDLEYRKWAISNWETAIQQAERNNVDVQSGEYRVTCKDGTVRAMIIGASVIGDSLLVSLFDITERKWAESEREKLQEQLLQSQKLEAIGILAGGVAHDFNNMLGAIIGYAELTMDSMGADDPFRKNLSKILDAAQRSAGLTRQLLAFARKQTVNPIVFELNTSVESMLRMLRRLIGENIELAWMPASGACTVKMDPSQIDQILANLCVNARDAIADVGKITIRAERAFFDGAACEKIADCVPGEYVMLAVSDNGCGMDRETAAHVFEPFFTTKGVGKGTGLGLSTVYGIVRQNEGFVVLYSEPGHGTTFKIYIPRYMDAAASEKAERAEEIPRSHGETVLIVEDDPTLLEMGVMMLQRLGYEFLSAATPNEAIRIAEKKDVEIHLLITDVVMPEMNGRELAEHILTLRPGVKHLFMSGYTADVIVHQGALDKGVSFIQKPFSSRELAVKIRAVLDGAAGVR